MQSLPSSVWGRKIGDLASNKIARKLIELHVSRISRSWTEPHRIIHKLVTELQAYRHTPNLVQLCPVARLFFISDSMYVVITLDTSLMPSPPSCAYLLIIGEPSDHPPKYVIIYAGIPAAANIVAPPYRSEWADINLSSSPIWMVILFIVAAMDSSVIKLSPCYSKT